MKYQALKEWTDKRDVTLIAVSKTHPASTIKEIYDMGHRDFGENRAQELLDKVDDLPQDIRWHMIGTLQSNKIRAIVPHVHMIHSVNRIKILNYINREAENIGKTVDILIQIHIAEEESKHGFTFAEAEKLFSEDLSTKYPSVRFRGLMGIATFTDDKEVVANEFESLNAFFKTIQESKKEVLPDFNCLSMGMSGDYEIAVEHGSNMIRVGSLIFGQRDYN